MDPSEFGDTLRIECPRCGHVDADDYEVLDAWVPLDWRCAACERVFSVRFAECVHCGWERVESATHAAEHADAQGAICPACGKPCSHHEDASECADHF